jgi:hypothetical protein
VLSGSPGGAGAYTIQLVNNVFSNSAVTIVEFGDNVDDILIDGNTMNPLVGTVNGFLHYGTVPTTPSHIKVTNNTVYATTSGGYNLVAWGVTDNLSEWDVRGNTIYMGNGVQGIVWAGKELIFNDNIINIGTGAVSVASALLIAVTEKARLNGNTFNNSTTTAQAVSASTANIILGLDNTFTQYFYNSGINSNVPASGYYTIGTEIPKWNPSVATQDIGGTTVYTVVAGWKRLISGTGTTVAANGDWVEMRSLVGGL